MSFRSFLYSFVFVLFFVPSVFATEGYTPISSPTCDVSTSDCSAVTVLDNVFATNSSSLMSVSTTQFEVLQGTRLTSLNVKIKAYHTGGAGTGGGFTVSVQGCSGSFTWNALTLPNNAIAYEYEKYFTDTNEHICGGVLTITTSLSWGAGGVNGIDFIEYKLNFVDSETQGALESLFFPSDNFTSDIYDDVIDSFSSKAPFAYFYPLFSFDTSDPTTMSATPQFTLTINSLGTPVSGSLDHGITYIDQFFSVFKNFVRFALYLSFIVYLVLLVRRIFLQ